MSHTYSLEPYRSLEEKKMLLKESLDTEDGNTILTVFNIYKLNLGISLWSNYNFRSLYF